MISSIFNNFDLTHQLFTESFTNENHNFCFNFEKFLQTNNLFNFDYNFFFNLNPVFSDNSFNTLINQSFDLSFFENLENTKTIYHYSIPNTKLHYPEPFIASASFMHTDLWFVHILIYQYWLWFVFIFLIVFFFLTFVSTVRWCNMRIRPRRETRGVSRSKCGDLITACVPVSWATSIIVNESTDAIDYYDGFGTTELVVGIRAYQWGWEYYYPKDIDLHYNVKPSYSSFIGNSLKYNISSEKNLKTQNLWKFYQNKVNDAVITPSHILLLPIDNFKIFNFLNFNDISSNFLNESSAFKNTKLFSKTFTFNLTKLNDNFTNKYSKVFSLFTNESILFNSYIYGFKKQHNFLSKFSLSNNLKTQLGKNSVHKLTSYNYQNYQKLTANNMKTFNFFIQLLLSDFAINNDFQIFNNFTKYDQLLNFFNNDSDKKHLHNPFFKLFNKGLLALGFESKKTLQNFNHIGDHYTIDFKPLVSLLYDKNKINKTINLFSSNQSISLSNKSIRGFADVVNNSKNFNYNNGYLSNNLFNYTHDDVYGFYQKSQINWIELGKFNKLVNNRVFIESPYSPIVSNNAKISLLSYDNLNKNSNFPISNILQGKDELIPNAITSLYWNFYWANTNISWRFNSITTLFNITNDLYMPIFNFYYDYDFRNWQTLEILEDSYWETFNPSLYYDDFLNTKFSFYQNEYFDKIESESILNGKNVSLKENMVNSMPFWDAKFLGYNYANIFFTEEGLLPQHLTILNNFSNILFLNVNNFIDDSFESLKYLNYFYNQNHKIFLNLSVNFFNLLNSTQVLNMFRSDFEDFFWYFDDKNNLKQSLSVFNSFTKLSNNFKIVELFPIFENNSIIEEISNFKNNRFSNLINLRNSAKSSIVTYNAIQKVFHSRFDENRSNIKLIDFANFSVKQPFISSSRPLYENMLGKNFKNFYTTNFYKNNKYVNLNSNYAIWTSLNCYFFDFPFLLAYKSDASRYLWFDWFARWGFYEVQPSSSSRYAIHGMPYFAKNFEFNTNANELLNETENYLIRLLKARKNYLANWNYSPYFFFKNNIWFRNTNQFDSLNTSFNELFTLQVNLYFSNWYWNFIFLQNNNNICFTPTNSNINSYSKSFWKPYNSVQSYFYNVTNLTDILTKRDYLYRQLYFSNGKLLPFDDLLVTSPNNLIVNDLKSLFFLTNLTSYTNEYSYNVHYDSLFFFNFNILKIYLKSFETLFNFEILVNYFFFYFFNTKSQNIFENSNELYKNQYRPLKKGISNMIRLHATGAIAMPIEIRLQILASSKDVIHSWAIPSAGIKIDCVPGYSSHKVMIFLVSGIFWGQCMEVCGRYHHWMPIVIYFMKRDLFFLWCTHFVFLTNANTSLNINDRQYVNYVKTVSFDKSSWLTELLQ